MLEMEFMPLKERKYTSLNGNNKRRVTINDNELPSPPSRQLSSIQKVPSMSDLSEESSLGESTLPLLL